MNPSVLYSYCNAYDITTVDVQLCDPEIVFERFTKADERTAYSSAAQQNKMDESE